MARALALGARGRRFESYHPDCEACCWEPVRESGLRDSREVAGSAAAPDEPSTGWWGFCEAGGGRGLICRARASQDGGSARLAVRPNRRGRSLRREHTAQTPQGPPEVAGAGKASLRRAGRVACVRGPSSGVLCMRRPPGFVRVPRPRSAFFQTRVRPVVRLPGQQSRREKMGNLNGFRLTGDPQSHILRYDYRCNCMGGTYEGTA